MTRVGGPMVPAGFRDILPAEAAQLRYVEGELRRTFELSGYGELITPALEFEATWAPAVDSRVSENLFSLLDRDGRMLSLRPELTTAIARVVAQRFGDQSPPYRFYYLADVFRQYEPRRGQLRQFRQAGVELIGEGNAYADAEVILLLCACFSALGLKDFSIGLGQIEFLRAQLKALPISDNERAGLKETLARHNIVEFESRLRASLGNTDLVDKALASLELRGGVEVLSKARELALNDDGLAAIDRLRQVYELVSLAGASDRVLIDLGIIRRFDYYTGIIIEAYSLPLGFPIGGGGRYDNLLGGYGEAYQAAGFAVRLERLHIALEESKVQYLREPDCWYVYDEKDPKRAMFAAERLRQEGQRAVGCLRPVDEKAATLLSCSVGKAKLIRAADVDGEKE